MSVSLKLADVQSKLKAPKNQYNSFGKYNYRSCEDILEAAKPLCIKNGLTLTISDEIVGVGMKNYIKATATVIEVETNESISVHAYAREAEIKKGMDDAQITGATSSYARKYALNGLFCIDDTKDVDTVEYQKQHPEQQSHPVAYVCEKCQTPFTEFEWNGKKYTAGQAYEIAKKKYSAAICYSCAKKSGLV